jgi:cell division protein FtsQ
METETIQHRFDVWQTEPERRKTIALSLTKRRPQSHKALALLLVLGIFTVSYIFGWFDRITPSLESAIKSGSRQAGLVVQEIRVKGLRRVDRGELEAALGFTEGDLLLDLNIAAARKNIESLPWIKRASIARQLPDIVLIEVQERQAFALWQHNSAVWLIDRDGVQITLENLEQFGELPYLVGLGAPRAAAEIIDLLRAEPDLANRVDALIRVGERRWDIEFDTGARLRLPEPGADYGPRTAWNRFAAIQRDHGLLSREVASFDMRLADRLIMQATPDGLKLMSRRDRGT